MSATVGDDHALNIFCLSLQVEDKDYLEKVNGKLSLFFKSIWKPSVTLKTFHISNPSQGSRASSAFTAGTLTSLGGTSSRRGSCETAVTLDAEMSLREIKVIGPYCVIGLSAISEVLLMKEQLRDLSGAW